MKTDSTVDMARAVEPKTRVSSRVHTASKTRPEAPERKKHARTRPVIVLGRLASGPVSIYERRQPTARRAGRRVVTVALVKPLIMSRAPAIASDEQALVEACRRGERQALHAFYERYRRRVFSLIARIVGAQDAEELAQEVFLRAFRGLDKLPCRTPRAHKRGKSGISVKMR
jgi:hypothetical protein